MSNPSVLADLLEALPDLRQQVYFKTSLTALSHAMEDQVLARSESALVIASFQRERFYRQEAHRYRRIADRTNQVYVLAAPETDFKNSSEYYETIAFDPTDALSQEWHLVVIGSGYATCLICREKSQLAPTSGESPLDNSRRFEGIWTFEREVTQLAAERLLSRILQYRPELEEKVSQAKSLYLKPTKIAPPISQSPNPDPFVQRLVTYLQAGQYKLMKAYRSIASQQQKERLINSITAAIRRSLNTEEILQVAVEELGEAIAPCRCLIYCCKETDRTVRIAHEFLKFGVDSVLGQTWLLQDNPLFQEVVAGRERVYVEETATDSRLRRSNGAIGYAGGLRPIASLVRKFKINSWLLVPVLYQDRLLGMVELHHCDTTSYEWEEVELSMVEAIATQIGAALIQAEAYTNLQDLNQQLEALDRTRSNLVAITGHELRTPLSTIQVCLESLASEPDMSPELRQIMLNTALSDAERMRKLVQDFLTLSRLESGRVEWHPEPLSLPECVDLALSSIRSRRCDGDRPTIATEVPDSLPLVQADGEWLVEVIAKLLDNACKFTTSPGEIIVRARPNSGKMLEVTIADTGRGIEPNRLEVVFDRFYQEEGALRRTTGGTGLGLAICRQIVSGWGGNIWADSAGKDQGSQFHFTIPIFDKSGSRE